MEADVAGADAGGGDDMFWVDQAGGEADVTVNQVRPDADEVLVPDAELLGEGPGLRVGTGVAGEFFAGVWERVHGFGEAAVGAHGESTVELEKLPGLGGAIGFDEALHGDAVEPRPDRAIVVRGVLVPLAGGEVVRRNCGSLESRVATPQGWTSLDVRRWSSRARSGWRMRSNAKKAFGRICVSRVPSALRWSAS